MVKNRGLFGNYGTLEVVPILRCTFSRFTRSEGCIDLKCSCRNRYFHRIRHRQGRVILICRIEIYRRWHCCKKSDFRQCRAVIDGTTFHLCNTTSKHHFRQFRTRRNGVCTKRLSRLCKGYLRKIRPIESTRSIILCTWQRGVYLNLARCAIKDILTKRQNTLADGRTSQCRTVVKSIRTDRFYAIRNTNLLECATPRKGIVTNRAKSAGQNYSFKTRASLKGVFANRSQCFRQNYILQDGNACEFLLEMDPQRQEYFPLPV